jgi:iron complex transport system ATP-binding protein
VSLLKIENLSTGYEKKSVINEICLEIPKGAFVGIMGPNGAGKSTLFKAISKILPPWSGKILYKDSDISGLSVKEFAKQISTIPQFFEVPFSFTVEEFILMGRYPHRGRLEPLKSYDFKIAEEVIALFDITPYRKRRVSSLSGGELQRVVLAQGLAQEPELLLLDEPTSHLDIGHQIRIMDLIRSLNKQKGLTVIAILHDLNLASYYCDTLVLLKEGKIFTSGPTENVLTYQNIEHVYDTTVVVEKDPVSQRPHVFLVPSQALDASVKREP